MPRPCRPSCRLVRLLIRVLCALASLAAPLSPALAASPTSVELPGHVLTSLARAKDLGLMPPQQTLKLTIVLQPKGTIEVPATGRATTSNPITIARAIGRSQSDVDTLSAYFTSNGLRVSPPHSDRLHLSLEGTVAQIQQTFGITLNDFQDSQGRRFYATATNPRLPNNLAAMVQAVIGLNSTASLQPMHTPPRSLGTPTTTAPISHAASTTGDFTPADMRTAYGLSTFYDQGDNGSGQTIGIIGCDAFNQSDIRSFETQYGLPQVPISTVNVDGGGSGSDIETALDLEWSNAIAPNAALVYYSFPADSSGGCSDAGFYDAVMSAVNQNHANILSISLGECETSLSPAEVQAFETAFAQAAANNQSVFVASGDSGAYACQDQNGNPVLGVSYPASSAYVTAVGGTTLSLNSDGSYANESAWGSWSECQGGCGSGGGVSQVISEPSWQQSVNQINATGMRGVPDVAYNADPATGNLVYWNGGWYEVGGTSIATPQWAGIAAIADQVAGDRLGFFSPYLYTCNVINAQGSASPPYHDVASGSNLYYNAVPGWDFATGWGSPQAYDLLTLITGSPTLTAAPLNVTSPYSIYIPLVVNSSPSAGC